MPNKNFLYAFLLMLVGCQQPAQVEQSAQPKQSEQSMHSQTNVQRLDDTKPAQDKSSIQQEPTFSVSYLPKLEEAGDAALFTGTLNDKNGCLYVDDYLVVVVGIYVKWQNDPFWIGNGQGEKFQLGDRVSLGGSQIPYNTMYDNSPDKKCKANNIWLTHGVMKPL